MLAIVQNKHKKLKWTSHPMVAPQAHESLVRVRACGVNRADVLQAKGLYSAPAGTTNILGLEFAGELENGKRVMGLVPGGAFAQYVSVPTSQLVEIPEAWTFQDAASMMEGLATSWQGLSYATNIGEGSRVVVTAANGGIGTVAVQVSSMLGAATIAVTRDRKYANEIVELGAQEVLSVSEWLEGSDRCAADHVLDCYGGDGLAAAVSNANPKAHIVCIGLLRGINSTIPMNTFLMKNLQLHAFTMRSLSDIARNTNARMVEQLLAKGELRPVVRAEYHVSEIDRAFADMKRGGQLGKIVLHID